MPEPPDLKAQAAALRVPRAGLQAGSLGEVSVLQYRFYVALLMFVVLVGLPILSIPDLRHRLSARVQSLYSAMDPSSLKPTPAWAKVGENRYPFPEEFRRPEPPAIRYPGVVQMPGMVYRRGGEAAPQASQTGGSASMVEGSREPDASGGETAPQFRQGKIEQEAYDLLIKSSETISGMVKGANPLLRFKSWSAAKMEEDAFWVDLTFTQASDNTEVHYVWKVQLLSKEVTPLSHNARTLPKS